MFLYTTHRCGLRRDFFSFGDTSILQFTLFTHKQFSFAIGGGDVSVLSPFKSNLSPMKSCMLC